MPMKAEENDAIFIECNDVDWTECQFFLPCRTSLLYAILEITKFDVHVWKLGIAMMKKVWSYLSNVQLTPCLIINRNYRKQLTMIRCDEWLGKRTCGIFTLPFTSSLCITREIDRYGFYSIAPFVNTCETGTTLCSVSLSGNVGRTLEIVPVTLIIIYYYYCSVSSSLSNIHLGCISIRSSRYHLTGSSTRAHLSKMFTEKLALDESQQWWNKSLVFIDSCILYQYIRVLVGGMKSKKVLVPLHLAMSSRWFWYFFRIPQFTL